MRQSIDRIIQLCADPVIHQRDRQYMMEKTSQLKMYRRELIKSIDRIKQAQSDFQEEERPDQDDLDEVMGSNHKSNTTRLRPKFTIKLKNNHQKLIRFKTEKSLQRHHFENLSQRRHSPKLLIVNDRKIRLPNLLSKVRKGKLPTNASKNSELKFQQSSRSKEDVDCTYQEIKIERKKAEEMRHMMVLGKVMSENYRKQLRDLELRKKMFLQVKYSQI